MEFPKIVSLEGSIDAEKLNKSLSVISPYFINIFDAVIESVLFTLESNFCIVKQ